MLDFEASIGRRRVKFSWSFMQSESHRDTSEITGDLHACKGLPIHSRGDQLVDILAGIVRSALAWEAAHGYPADISNPIRIIGHQCPELAQELSSTFYPSGAEAAGKDQRDEKGQSLPKIIG